MLRFPSPSLAVSIVALVVALGGASYSATGGNFILGQSNSAATQTRLVAPFNGPAFRIDNLNTGTGASGLRIITNAARPPMVVNSAVKVANLNADLLDGVDATGFVRGGGIVDGQAITMASGATVSSARPWAGSSASNISVPLRLAAPALSGSTTHPA